MTEKELVTSLRSSRCAAGRLQFCIEQLTEAAYLWSTKLNALPMQLSGVALEMAMSLNLSIDLARS